MGAGVRISYMGTTLPVNHHWNNILKKINLREPIHVQHMVILKVINGSLLSRFNLCSLLLLFYFLISKCCSTGLDIFVLDFHIFTPLIAHQMNKFIRTRLKQIIRYHLESRDRRFC